MFVVTLVPLAGCQQAGSSVEVLVADGGKFPEFLAGKWREKENGWEFVIEPDGKISSLVHTIGRVTIRPGRTTTVPMIKKGKGVYEPGPWLVYYAPDELELTIKVSLRHFLARFGKNRIVGESTDIFAGTVEPNSNFWTADWTSYPEYIVTTDTYKDYKLPMDPNEYSKGDLIFEKIAVK